MAITLQVGQPAPAFSGKDQKGNTVNLSDFAGRRLILFFYPADDTPGCTKEACNLRDNHQTLIDKGFAVVGVSPDDAASHQKFIDKYQLPFPLIADTDKNILTSYGAWGDKNMYGKIVQGVLRSTFLIDETGVIMKIFKKVDTAAHTEQILKALS